MSPRNTKLGQHQPLLEVADGEASWSVGAEAILIVHYEYYKCSTKQTRHTVKLILGTLPITHPRVSSALYVSPTAKQQRSS